MKSIAFIYLLFGLTVSSIAQNANVVCDEFMDAKIWLHNEGQIEGIVCIGTDKTLTFRNGQDVRYINASQVQYMVVVQDNQVYEMYPLSFDYNDDGKLENTYFLKIYQANDMMLLTTECYDLDRDMNPGSYLEDTYRNYYNVVILADRFGNVVPVLKKKNPLFKNLTGFDRYRWVMPDQNNKVLTMSQTGKEYRDLLGTQYPRFQKRVKDLNLDLKTIEGWIEAIDF